MINGKLGSGITSMHWTKLEKEEDIDDVLHSARKAADEGRPVLINALIGKTDFRDGSISM